jgi:lysozyme
MTLRDDLIRDEGFRLKPYRCTAGKLTIGVGRNLEDLGISRDEALYLLDNDIVRVRAEVIQAFPWFVGLTQDRQEVILSMVFNLGLYRFSRFHQTIKAIQAGDYQKAARQMRGSLWYRQVGARAERLAQRMETE